LRRQEEAKMTTTTDMHRYMVPLLGFVFVLALLISWLLLAFKPSMAAVLRWVSVGLCGLQIFICLFFWFNPNWPVTLQLTVVAAYGLFAFISNNVDHVKYFTIASLFDALVCIGKMQFLGYGDNLMDALVGTTCQGYYDVTDEAICDGYLNYLQFLAFNLILLQPFLVFFGLIWYKEQAAGNEHGSLLGATRYDTIGSGHSGEDKQYSDPLPHD